MENDTLIQYFHWYLPADGLYWNRLSDEALRLKAKGLTAFGYYRPVGACRYLGGEPGYPANPGARTADGALV